jgi:RHS repeat-associated protein
VATAAEGAEALDTSYTFNNRNRLEMASVGSDKTSFLYYPDGKKKSVSYPNGAGESLEYWPNNRVKSIINTAGGATISSYAYEYDDNGNRTGQIEVQAGKTLITGYSYDTLDRMTGYSVDDGSSASYSFDGYNRATETVTDQDGDVVTKNYSYDETDWLTGVDDGTHVVSYGYDENGNTIRKSDSDDTDNDTVFDYDVNNRLVRVIQGTTLLGLYDYDAQGMRVRHRNSDRGDVDYFYDGKSVVEERLPSGELLAHYNYADKLMSLATPAGNQYYHIDALGSTVNLTDGQGNVKTSYFLNPWGMILEQIGESVNRHVFTGKEEDANTGLVYFGQRYYDADTGRFITEDSYLGKPDTPESLHRYLYCYSNPTTYVDHDGHSADIISAPAFGAALAASIEANPGALPILVGGATYYVTSKSIEGTRLGNGGFGETVYDWTHPNPKNGKDNFVPPVVITKENNSGKSDNNSEKKNKARQGNHTGQSSQIQKPKHTEEKKSSTQAEQAADSADKGVDLEQTGSYTNTHQSGKTYSGKGSRKRSQTSGRREAEKNKDPHVSTDWTPAESERDAFKEESRRLDKKGGASSDTNYNRLESPGKKYRIQDGEAPAGSPTKNE